MAHNPRIVDARGSGQEPKGPDAENGGFDSISYWLRTGAAAAITPADAKRPLPGPAFGDMRSGMMLAGGIGSAVGYRHRTRTGVIVDLSLCPEHLESEVSGSEYFDVPLATVGSDSPDDLAAGLLCEDVQVVVEGLRAW
jgi:hypothetical protein